PFGSAPFFHHRAMAGGALTFQVASAPATPFLLVAGAPGPAMSLGAGGQFELSLTGLQIIANGLAPSGVLDLGAIVGAFGTWQLALPGGLPPAFGTRTLQGIVSDPTLPPLNLRATASLTLEITNDLDSLARNVLDGLDRAFVQPDLLAGTCSTTFRFGGWDRAGFVSFEAARRGGFIPDDVAANHTTFGGLFPESPVAPALPIGPPAAGASLRLGVELTEDYGQAACPIGVAQREVARIHGLSFVEENGVWRFDGDQREVDATIQLQVLDNVFNPGGPTVSLAATVEDPLGQRGGIASLDLTGPQLQSVVNGVAQTASNGTVTMNFSEGFPNGGSEWTYGVQIGMVGTSSRLPLHVDATGIRDSYDLTVHWNDGSTSGPYALPLRASIDVQANFAAAVAAIPGRSTLSAALSNPSSPSAMVALTHDLGTLPATSDFSSLVTIFTHNASPTVIEYEFESLAPTQTTGIITQSYCTPFLAPAPAFTSLILAATDRFGAQFVLITPLTL
ncbi:MAG: hypothetical protein KDB53_04265, partial [Planctomycetes bacterium]|nr:hypothetical protein [Planctomycetota bacterium]